MAGATQRPPTKGKTNQRPAKGKTGRPTPPHILHAPAMAPRTRQEVYDDYIDGGPATAERGPSKSAKPGPLDDPRAWWQANRVGLTPPLIAAGMLAGSTILFKEHAPLWAPLIGAGVNGWSFLPVWAPRLAKLGERGAKLGEALLKSKRAPSWKRPAVHKYARALTAAGALWCSLAAFHGPDGPLLLWLVAGGLAGAVPWWKHHEVRPPTPGQADDKALLEEWQARWADVRDRLNLKASRAIKAINVAPEDIDEGATGISVELTIQLVPGVQVAGAVKGMRGAIESALRLPTGSVRVETVASDASLVTIRIVTIDAGIVTWEAVAKLAPTSLAGGGKFVLGRSENGGWKRVDPRGHWMIIGGTRSGKSTWLHAFLAQLTGCDDAVILGVDLKGGSVLRRWDGALHRVAITRPQAEKLLTAGNRMIDERAKLPGVSEGDGDQLTTSKDLPAVFIVMDECAEGLGSKNKANRKLTELAESIARRGAAMAIYLVLISQDGSLNSFGTEALRGQLSRRLCFKVTRSGNAQYVLTGYTRLPVTELESGQFLYSDGRDDETPHRGPWMTPDDNTQLPQQIAAANAPNMAPLDAHTVAAGGDLLAELPRTVAEATGQQAAQPTPQTPAPKADPTTDQTPPQEDDDIMSDARKRAREMQNRVNALFEGVTEIPKTLAPATADDIDAELGSAEARMARGLAFDADGISRKALLELVGMSPAWTDQRLKALTEADVIETLGRGVYRAASAEKILEALKRYDARTRELASV